MRKLIFTMVSTAMAFTMIACAPSTSQQDEIIRENNTNDAEQVINPFVDYNTIEEAKQHLDYDVIVPTTIDGYDQTQISVMSDEMYQQVYRNTDDEITIRKASGSDDISGDFNTYSQNETTVLNDMTINLRGDNNLVHNATWTNGTYTYSVSSSKGLEQAAILELIQQIQ